MSDKTKSLIELYKDKFIPYSNFLDLGCGMGKDSIFMAKNGFCVTAIDISNRNIDNLNNFILKNDIKNIEAINDNFLNFDIEKNRYDIILLNNSLQFVERNTALSLINNIKERINNNGFIIISAFTEDDPTVKNNNQKNIRFRKNELKTLFNNFKIYYYFEGIIQDNPHCGMNFQHIHGITKIVAQKYNI